MNAILWGFIIILWIVLGIYCLSQDHIGKGEYGITWAALIVMYIFKMLEFIH